MPTTTKIETIVDDDGITQSHIKNKTSPTMVCMTRETYIKSESKREMFADFIGDYILVNPNTFEVYIGKSDDFISRINDHNRKKEFWTRLIIFKGEKKKINSTHIAMMEDALIREANSAHRYKLTNEQMSSHYSATPDDEELVEDWLNDIRKLIKLSVCPDLFDVVADAIPVGDVKEPVKIEEPAKPVCKFAHYSTERGAEGYLNECGKFVVIKGSAVYDARTSLTPKQVELREKLVKEGVIADGVLTCDYEFDSQALATNILLGRSSNKNKEWTFKGVY